MPLNQYLDDRLRQWQTLKPGGVVVFENLMIQGSLSCPQPYGPQLLADLDHYGVTW